VLAGHPGTAGAEASLAGPAGSALEGLVTFTATAQGVRVVAEVENAPPGEHGFHLHEKGDCSAPDFSSAGGHFNPGETVHAGPHDMPRHAGDFGNFTVGADGKGRLELETDLLTVEPGPNSVVGRAVVFHAAVDDLKTQPTGNAGGRLGCGVVAAVAAPAD
jgi:Cu-Zn family superoxide dismutase